MGSGLNFEREDLSSIYGLMGNINILREFYEQAMKTLYKWLNRRSQRRSFEWGEFNRILKRYGVLTPRITETKNTQLYFEFN